MGKNCAVKDSLKKRKNPEADLGQGICDFIEILRFYRRYFCRFIAFSESLSTIHKNVNNLWKFWKVICFHCAIWSQTIQQQNLPSKAFSLMLSFPMGRSEREEKIFFFVAHLRNRKRKKCCKWTRHNKKYARAIEEKIVLKKLLVACVSRRPSRSERPKTTEGNFFPPTIFSSVRIFFLHFFALFFLLPFPPRLAGVSRVPERDGHKMNASS